MRAAGKVLKVKNKKMTKNLKYNNLNNDKFSDNLKVPHKDENDGKEGGYQKIMVVELK